jgi:hypothetical protein
VLSQVSEKVADAERLEASVSALPSVNARRRLVSAA